MLPDCISCKVCSKCGNVHSATLEYFKPDKRRKDGLGSWCRNCANIDAAKYRYENHDKCIAATRRWQIENPEKALLNTLNWQARNPHKKKAITDKWFVDNKEYRREYSRQYVSTHLDWFRAAAQRRRARIKGLPYTLTEEEYQETLAYYNNSCAYCGISQNQLNYKLHQEHIIPTTQGGGYTKENIVPACRSCNGHKWQRTPEQVGMTLLK